MLSLLRKPNSPSHAAAGDDPRKDARLDFILVLTFTLAAFGIAGRLELNERWVQAARPFEHLQFDELPLTLLALSIGLSWFSWRRWREARLEILQRQTVEKDLQRSRIELRELSHLSMQRQEDERRALARELHDEMGQNLNAIKIEAVSLRNASHVIAGSPPPDFSRAACAIIELVDQVYGVVRQINQRLRPVALDELGLAAALEHCVDGWRQRLPELRFELQCSDNLAALDEKQAMALYRVVQESLTNIARHGQASRVFIQLTRIETLGRTALTVEDDGCGADLSSLQHGFGLVGMRERIEALSGTMEFLSAPHQGFRVMATLPGTRAVSST